MAAVPLVRNCWAVLSAVGRGSGAKSSSANTATCEPFYTQAVWIVRQFPVSEPSPKGGWGFMLYLGAQGDAAVTTSPKGEGGGGGGTVFWRVGTNVWSWACLYLAGAYRARPKALDIISVERTWFRVVRPWPFGLWGRNHFLAPLYRRTIISTTGEPGVK